MRHPSLDSAADMVEAEWYANPVPHYPTRAERRATTLAQVVELVRDVVG